MLKKVLKITSVVFAVFVIIWSAMLITDTVRSQNFKEPVFAKEIRVEADNNTIVYQGSGYTVKREYFTNQFGESFCGGSEVWLFGRLFSAVIV